MALIVIIIYNSELQIHTFVNMLSHNTKTLKWVHKEKKKEEEEDGKAGRHEVEVKGGGIYEIEWLKGNYRQREKTQKQETCSSEINR